MARNVLAVVGIALVSVITVAGCTAARPVVPVLRGNLAYSRGDFQSALVHYLSADDAASDPWVLFNTANVYYALGEQEAALETWDAARIAANAVDLSPALVHAASFNRGVLLFERGQFASSYDEFRYALSLVPASMSTKINLELALDRSRSSESSGSSSESDEPADTPGEEDTSTLRILEYVRRQEANQWIPNTDDVQDGSARDW